MDRWRGQSTRPRLTTIADHGVPTPFSAVDSHAEMAWRGPARASAGDSAELAGRVNRSSDLPRWWAAIRTFPRSATPERLRNTPACIARRSLRRTLARGDIHHCACIDASECGRYCGKWSPPTTTKGKFGYAATSTHFSRRCFACPVCQCTHGRSGFRPCYPACNLPLEYPSLHCQRYYFRCDHWTAPPGALEYGRRISSRSDQLVGVGWRYLDASQRGRRFREFAR
jgi:hypothetical protein